VIPLKVLITGAGGFVGKYLTKALINKNMEVLGVSRSSGFLNGNPDDRYKCDVLKKGQIKRIIANYRPDYIVHLASPAFIPNSLRNPKKTYRTIFNGTLNLLECIYELRLPVRFLHVSSADVYGRGIQNCLKEDDPYDPINPYSSAKACSELLCRQFFLTYDLDVVIARPFNHTGPEQSIDFVCSNFAYQIASMRPDDEKVIYTGNVDVSRDFLDVRDVVEAYTLLLNKGKPGEVYNVCSGKGILIREIIDKLFTIANYPDGKFSIDPRKARKDDIKSRIGDNGKIISETGWRPNIDITETLKELYLYWKEKRDAER
jgi:GDP-4-dehydro-6-deoxy-D-mannose reductase